MPQMQMPSSVPTSPVGSEFLVSPLADMQFLASTLWPVSPSSPTGATPSNPFLAAPVAPAPAPTPAAAPQSLPPRQGAEKKSSRRPKQDKENAAPRMQAKGENDMPMQQ